MGKNVALVQVPGDSEQLYFLGIGALKSYLQREGHQVSLLLLNLLYENYQPSKIEESLQKNTSISKEQLSQNQLKIIEDFVRILIIQIKKISPEVVGFSVLESNVNTSLLLISILKNEFPDIHFILGGPETKNLDLPRQSLPFLSAIVHGEGEEILQDYLSHLDLQSFDGITGLEYQLSGKWSKNPSRMSGGNLQSYPLPDLKAIYDHPGFQTKFSNLIVLSFFRGCPYFCSFCSVHDYYDKYRSFPVEICLDEVEQYSDYNRPIFIADGICNGNPKWLKDFCQGIIARNLKVRWGGWFRLNKSMANPQTLDLLFESGCRHFVFGLESASGKVLQHMNKFSDMKTVYSIFNQMRKFNYTQDENFITVDLNLIVGYPTETESDFGETIKFVTFNSDLISGIASCQRFILPGWQGFRESVKDYGLKVNNQYDWETTYSTPSIRLDRLQRMQKLLRNLNIPISVNTVM